MTESSEDDVEQEDLDDDGGERRRHLRARPALCPFELVVNFVRALGDQEQAAKDQNQIAARNVLADGEERFGQTHHPGNRQQQRDADEHRQRQADLARPLPVPRAQLSGQDRNEDDVVDTEDDFENGQRPERNPSSRRWRPSRMRSSGNHVVLRRRRGSREPSGRRPRLGVRHISVDR